MSRISKLHLIHTTSTSKSSDTDGAILFKITHGGSTRTFPVNNLPHNEREKGKTDHYKLDVFDYNIDDGESLTCVLETQSTDGWLPKSVYVIAQNVDGACKLIAGDESWSGWLDKPSYVRKTIPASQLTTSNGTLSAIRVLATTSGNSSASSDGAIYLDLYQDGARGSYRLDTPNNDFSSKRTDEFVLSLNQSYTSTDNLVMGLRNASTDGWLPADVFAIGVHSDGKLKLLAAAPSWPESQWLDAPDRAYLPLENTYADTSWRELDTIDEETYYNLKVPFDNLYLGTDGHNYLPDHVELNQNEGNGGNQWQFKSVGSGAYQLINRLSGVALKGTGLTNDQLVTVYQTSINSACNFVPRRNSNGTYTLRYANNESYGIAVQGTAAKGSRLILNTSPTTLDLIPVRQYSNPEGSGGNSSRSMSPVAEFVLTVSRDGFSEVIDSKAPGGGTVFSMVFDSVFGTGGPDLEDMFDKFREDLLREMENMIANTVRAQAVGRLEEYKDDFLGSFMNQRSVQIDDVTDLPILANRAHEIGQKSAEEMAGILPEMAGYNVVVTPGNIAMTRAVFPVYVLASMQAISAYQEAAYLTALEAGLKGEPKSSYEFRLQTLNDQCAKFSNNIEGMYPAIWADRISQIKKKTEYENQNVGTILIPVATQKYWEDGKVGSKRFAEMSLNSSTTHQNNLKNAYLSAVEFSYTNYLFRHHDALLRMDLIGNRTREFCDLLQSSATTRNEFIAGAKEEELLLVPA